MKKFIDDAEYKERIAKMVIEDGWNGSTFVEPV
jgi:hypothetical protein